MMVGSAHAALLARQERIAATLHKFYRAAEKAFRMGAHHDHGWGACHRKDYFRKRALLFAREMNEGGGSDV